MLTLPETLQAIVRRAGESIALVEGDSRISYANLQARAIAIAQGLRTRGITDGDRVASAIGHTSDAVAVIYGAWLEDAFQLSLLTVGLGTSVIGAGELLGESITAGLGDRLGLKRMAIGGVALCVLTYLLLPIAAQTLPMALAGLFLHFCIFEMTIVTSLSVTTELLPEARATMIAAFYAAAGTGRVAGALMGGPVWLSAGIWGTVISSAALSALALAALLWALRGWKRN